MITIVIDEVIAYIKKLIEPTMCAQSWICISEDENIIIDSFETKDPRYNHLCRPFISAYAESLIDSDFNKIYLGKDAHSKTPVLDFNEALKPAKPKNYPENGYRDSHSQYLVKESLTIVEELIQAIDKIIESKNSSVDISNFLIDIFDHKVALKISEGKSISKQFNSTACVVLISKLFELAKNRHESFLGLFEIIEKLFNSVKDNNQNLLLSDALLIFITDENCKDKFIRKEVKNSQKLSKLLLDYLFKKLNYTYFISIKDDLRFNSIEQITINLTRNYKWLLKDQNYLRHKCLKIIIDLQNRYKAITSSNQNSDDSLYKVHNEYFLLKILGISIPLFEEKNQTKGLKFRLLNLMKGNPQIINRQLDNIKNIINDYCNYFKFNSSSIDKTTEDETGFLQQHSKSKNDNDNWLEAFKLFFVDVVQIFVCENIQNMKLKVNILNCLHLITDMNSFCLNQNKDIFEDHMSEISLLLTQQTTSTLKFFNIKSDKTACDALNKIIVDVEFYLKMLLPKKERTI